MSSSISFQDLAQTVMAILSGNHPLGAVAVSINQKAILSASTGTYTDGLIQELVMTARRANVSKDKDPQWIMLGPGGYLSVDGESIVYRQPGRGNYYFSFMSKAGQLHPASVVVAASERLMGGSSTPARMAA